MMRKWKDLFTTYSWHLKYKDINYIGIIVDFVEGDSYCMYEIKILYPENGREGWDSKNDFKEFNKWSYGKEDIECIVDVNKLPPKVYDKILAELL